MLLPPLSGNLSLAELPAMDYDLSRASCPASCDPTDHFLSREHKLSTHNISF
jgi:hypothetical protein